MRLTDIFTNLMFAFLVGFAAYLLLVGFNDGMMTRRAQRENAARLAFKLAIREGIPRKEAKRRYKEVKREWKS